MVCLLLLRLLMRLSCHGFAIIVIATVVIVRINIIHLLSGHFGSASSTSTSTRVRHRNRIIAQATTRLPRIIVTSIVVIVTLWLLLLLMVHLLTTIMRLLLLGDRSGHGLARSGSCVIVVMVVVLLITCMATTTGSCSSSSPAHHHVGIVIAHHGIDSHRRVGLAIVGSTALQLLDGTLLYPSLIVHISCVAVAVARVLQLLMVVVVVVIVIVRVARILVRGRRRWHYVQWLMLRRWMGMRLEFGGQLLRKVFLVLVIFI